MKLLFAKDENSEINVLQEMDGEYKEFSYVNMIKALIESKSMDEPEIKGDFSDAELKSIKSMVAFINKEISKAEQEEPVA
jgi:hypothetical protein